MQITSQNGIVYVRNTACLLVLLAPKREGIGVNPAGDTGDVSPPKIGLRGTVMHYVPPKFSF